jgi:hypothetical protein
METVINNEAVAVLNPVSAYEIYADLAFAVPSLGQDFWVY